MPSPLTLAEPAAFRTITRSLPVGPTDSPAPRLYATDQAATAEPAEIVVGKPFVTVRDSRARISCVIQCRDKDKVLWYEVEEAFRDYLSEDVSDAFVVAALIPAVENGCALRVHGPMSAKLYYNISNYLIPVLSDYLRKPRRAEIRANAFVSEPAQRGKGVAAGFSGGVDSFCNLHDHARGRVPDEFALTHFLFNNVGSHGQHSAEVDRAIFAARSRPLQDCAASLGVPAIAVDSNLDEFLGGLFQVTHTLRNASVALLMQNEFAKFLYSSGYPLEETRVGPDDNMSRLDPVILPWLGTERLECIAAGGQHTRTEKTRRVLAVPQSRQYLDVCVTPSNARPGFANCGMCWKCIRTAVTIKAYGRLDEYGAAFPRAEVDLFENLYLIEALGGSSPYAKEVRELVINTAYPAPPLVRLIAAVLPSFLCQQMSIRVIPFLVRRRGLARLVNRLLAW